MNTATVTLHPPVYPLRGGDVIKVDGKLVVVLAPPSGVDVTVTPIEGWEWLRYHWREFRADLDFACWKALSDWYETWRRL